MSRSRGTPLVISAPSGTGKTSVCRAVVERDPGVVFSTSHTTRAPRPGERDGIDYHFVTAEAFRALADEGAFLEYAEYSGNLYGTTVAAVEEQLSRGIDVLLEIETEGARQVRARRSDAVLVFILPPSWAALVQRLRGRGTDTAEEVDRRLAIARREFQAARAFDYFVINEALEAAIERMRALLDRLREGDMAGLQRQFGREAVAAELDAELGAHLRDAG